MLTRPRTHRRSSGFFTPGSSPRRALVIAAALLAAGLIPLIGSGPAIVEPTPVASQTETTSPASPTVSSTPVATPVLDQPEFARTLSRLVSDVEADPSLTVGVAVVAVAPRVGSPVVAGTLVTGPAWSTIKVPLVLAVEHRGSPDPSTSALISATITRSDNGAADTLYASLGDPVTASGLVQSQLAAHGDPVTRVPSQRARAGFSIIGQADWTLADAARFTATLPCSADAAQVWQLMGRIDASQAWGLGRISGAHFKGGWGPQRDGSYLVRQIGVLPTSDGGMVAVAIGVRVGSGDFHVGTLTLDRLSRALAPVVATASGGC